MAEDYYTEEGVGFVDATRADAVEEARKRHHLATGDPEPERDGPMTGPAHEEKYGLERAEQSAAIWRAAGVHPTENRALVGDEEGAENLAGAAVVDVSDVDASQPAPETASSKSATETASAPRPSA